MENNDNQEKQYKCLYSEIKGTGPISTIIFSVAVTVLMYILSKISG